MIIKQMAGIKGYSSGTFIYSLLTLHFRASPCARAVSATAVATFFATRWSKYTGDDVVGAELGCGDAEGDACGDHFHRFVDI